MKILRTVFWVLAALAFLVFAAYNWQPVELTLWQNLVLETKVPMLLLLAFIAGFVPMWAVHRSVLWGMNRRIRTLENSLKTNAMAQRGDSGGTGVVPVADSAAGTGNPVDKPGKTPGEHRDPFDPSDDAADTGGSDGGGDGGGGGGGD